ncbi:hypothetical protein IJ090_03175 [Candidatus Saccharibacteria bacterium]|nr:hypothetical protein [Candidatus Saccharibacteria bacterium]
MSHPFIYIPISSNSSKLSSRPKRPWTFRRVLKIILISFAIILAIIIISEIEKRAHPERYNYHSNQSTSSQSTNTSKSSKSDTTKPSTSQSTKSIQSQTESKSQVTQPEVQTEEKPPAEPEPQAPTEQPQETATPSCWHYVSGRCYDDLEDEAAAAGYYDRLNGDYEGRSFDYPDDCDAECQDILEESYYDGYYDY